jgi:AcrR family transcriptional regulator
MTDVAELGLRERKRLATRRAIQLAALRLVMSRGLDNVTIDDISHDADISPRTFFNYFASKESALVGEGPSRPSEADVEAFVDGHGGLLEDLARMMTAAAGQALQDQEVITLRKSLASDYPHLTAMRMQTFQDFQRELVAIVARRLAQQDPALAAEPKRLESRAHLITMVSLAAMHHAWATWAAEPDARDTIVDRMRASFVELAEVIEELSR